MKEKGAKEFYTAINNCEQVEPPPTERKGFKMFKLNDFLEQEYKETYPIIENILNKNQTAIIGGATGSKKSMLAIQCALSIASGVPLMGHFKVKPQKVVLIQMENENFDMQFRFNTMVKHYIELEAQRKVF